MLEETGYKPKAEGGGILFYIGNCSTFVLVWDRKDEECKVIDKGHIVELWWSSRHITVRF